MAIKISYSDKKCDIDSLYNTLADVIIKAELEERKKHTCDNKKNMDY